MDITLHNLIDELNSRSNNKHDLARYQEIIQQLNLVPDFPIILVAGTNGKGSICEYLSSIYTQAGYTVGCYTSPHVFEYNERIKIKTKAISNHELLKYLSVFAQYKDLGLFHAFTLSAISYYIDNNVDLAIIEVGIGGAEDITNLFEPELSIISNVDLDHCDLLGSSLEEIAAHKAGIMRRYKTTIYGDNAPPITILQKALKNKVNLQIIGIDFDYAMSEHSWKYLENNNNLNSLPTPSLRGNNQYKNAATALKAINTLQYRFPVTLSSVKYGLINTNLIGRFQVMPGSPIIVLDTAHNAPAVATMLNNITLLPYSKKTVAVFAIANNKDIDTIIKLSKNYFQHWFIAPINNQLRKIDNPDIVKIFYNNGIKDNLTLYNTIDEATKAALTYSLTNDAKIICFGSFITVANAYLTIKKVQHDG